jgi:hypothetical protein
MGPPQRSHSKTSGEDAHAQKFSPGGGDAGVDPPCTVFLSIPATRMRIAIGRWFHRDHRRLQARHLTKLNRGGGAGNAQLIERLKGWFTL